MRIVFVGTVEFSRRMLEKLISMEALIVGVITKKTSEANADFSDLSGLCEDKDIPYKYVTDINSPDSEEWIKDREPDIILCLGFSQILEEKILKIAPMGVVGYHPAKLPQNRGRHPIIWALVLGLKKTASTFFFMDKGADSGDILSQEEIEIDTEDDAGTLYEKVVQTALSQLNDILPQLEGKTFDLISQNGVETNYWRKRNMEDGRVDFRMTARAVCNLIRGLTRPYVGAHIRYNNADIKVWKAKEIITDFENCEYGKVLDVSGGQILVKCMENAVLFMKHEFNKLPETGDYLI